MTTDRLLRVRMSAPSMVTLSRPVPLICKPAFPARGIVGLPDAVPTSRSTAKAIYEAVTTKGAFTLLLPGCCGIRLSAICTARIPESYFTSAASRPVYQRPDLPGLTHPQRERLAGYDAALRRVRRRTPSSSIWIGRLSGSGDVFELIFSLAEATAGSYAAAGLRQKTGAFETACRQRSISLCGGAQSCHGPVRAVTGGVGRASPRTAAWALDAFSRYLRCSAP